MMTSHARNYNNEGRNFIIIFVPHLTLRTILRCKQVHKAQDIFYAQHFNLPRFTPARAAL